MEKSDNLISINGEKNIPAWTKIDYIYGSYRPVSNSIKKSILSIFDWHNGTIFIWSHIVASCVVIVDWMNYLFYHMHNYKAMEKIVMNLFYFSAFQTFLASASYHIIKNHSEKYYEISLKIDILSLLFCGGSNFISTYAYLFNNSSFWMSFFTIGTGIVFIPLPIFYLKIYKIKDKTTTRIHKTILALLIISQVSPYIYFRLSVPQNTCTQDVEIVKKYINECFILTILTIAFYIIEPPERFFPGKFDMFFNSHQIVHILSILIYQFSAAVLYTLQQYCA
ncbi:MAG: hypothetical protein MHMPM18_000203 [Marteilia pararefringens]